MLLECNGCHKYIELKYDDFVCNDCRFGPKYMMSTTEAKTKYKLTQDEIDNANLQYHQFEIHHNIGTRYLRVEIDKLAKELYKEYGIDNPRRSSYNKAHAEYKQKVGAELKHFVTKRKQVMRNIEVLLVKIGDYDIDMKNYNFLSFVDVTTKTDDTALVVANNIVNELKESIEREHNKKLANQQLLLLIQNANLGENFHAFSTNHREYHDCLANYSKSPDEYFEIISKEYSELLDREAKISNILSTKNLSETDLKHVKSHKSYKLCITGELLDFDQTINTIVNEVIGERERKNKKATITRWINKHVNRYDRDRIPQSLITSNESVDQITKKISEFIMAELKGDEYDSYCKRHRIKRNHRNYTFYKRKYINNEITLDNIRNILL